MLSIYACLLRNPVFLSIYKTKRGEGSYYFSLTLFLLFLVITTDLLARYVAIAALAFSYQFW